MAAERLGTLAPLCPVTEDERTVSLLIRPVAGVLCWGSAIIAFSSCLACKASLTVPYPKQALYQDEFSVQVRDDRRPSASPHAIIPSAS